MARKLFRHAVSVGPRYSYNARQPGRIDSDLQQVRVCKICQFSVAVTRWIVEPHIGNRERRRLPWKVSSSSPSRPTLLSVCYGPHGSEAFLPRLDSMQNLKLDGNISEVVQMILAVVMGQCLGGKKICLGHSQWTFDFHRHGHGLYSHPCD